jgi:hypothetical protein
MHLLKHLGEHPWLFAGLAALPMCLNISLIVYFCLFGKHVETLPNIPNWASIAAISCLPVFSGAIGFCLAWSLSLFLQWQGWLAKKRLIRAYTALFTLLWSVVFGFLGSYAFAMGLGDGPAIASLEQLGQRLIGIMFIGFPISALISLAMSSVATLAVVLVCEAGMYAGLKAGDHGQK